MHDIPKNLCCCKPDLFFPAPLEQPACAEGMDMDTKLYSRGRDYCIIKEKVQRKSSYKTKKLRNILYHLSCKQNNPFPVSQYNDTTL